MLALLLVLLLAIILFGVGFALKFSGSWPRSCSCCG